MLDEFYNKIKDDYPHIEKEEIFLIAKSPFITLKTVISKGTLETVRIKHLGAFKVFKGTVNTLNKKNEDRYSRNLISEKEYTRLKTIIDSYEL